MAVTGSVAWRRPRWVLAPRRCFSPVVREARQPYGQGPRLLDRVRERIRTRHYSRRTEKAYVGWIRRYILFHGRRHPREMGAEELSRYHFARGRCEGERLDAEPGAGGPAVSLPRGPGPGRSLAPGGRAGEAAATASRGPHARRGTRRSERAARHAETHGGAPLRGWAPLVRVRQAPHQGRGLRCKPAGGAARQGRSRSSDRAAGDRAGRGWVELPGALARKYPEAARDWSWQWVFPATRPYVEPATGQRRRHHLHESVVQRAVKEAVRRSGI